MKIKPLNDRVLVRRIPEGMKSIIYIPDVARENSKRAEVIAVGPKVHGVKPGDVVLVPGAASRFPDWEREDYISIQVADIGGIFG